MRSSKSRSRSKSNRPRSIGNIINRVFDSSGPEGKVRGTPQQIIEKYLILARDAQLSNDRVAAENFLQHAEHYTRLLAEAQRELAAEQESRQQQYQQNGNNQGGQNFRERGGDQPRAEHREQREERDPGAGDQPDLGDAAIFPDSDSHLVDTPEMKPREGQNQRREGGEPRGPREQRDRREFRNQQRGPRENRPPRAEQEAPRAESAPAAESVAAEAPAPAEAAPPKPKKPAAPRKPRVEKPKAEPTENNPEAAE